MKPLVLQPSQMPFRSQRENTDSLSCNKVSFLSNLVSEVVTWVTFLLNKIPYQLSSWSFQGKEREPWAISRLHHWSCTCQILTCLKNSRCHFWHHPSHSTSKTMHHLQHWLPFIYGANIYCSNASIELRDHLFIFIYLICCVYIVKTWSREDNVHEFLL